MNGWMMLKWSRTKGWNEWKDGEEERRRRERKRRIDSRLDNRLGPLLCSAELKHTGWNALGLWFQWNSFSLKTFIIANLINGWWIKTLHNMPSSIDSEWAETFFWIMTWAQNSFGSSQSFNIRSSLRGNGCFWIANSPQMKLESRSNSPMGVRLLMGSLHHCIFVSLFKLLKSYKIYILCYFNRLGCWVRFVP